MGETMNIPNPEFAPGDQVRFKGQRFGVMTILESHYVVNPVGSGWAYAIEGRLYWEALLEPGGDDALSVPGLVKGVVKEIEYPPPSPKAHMMNEETAKEPNHAE